MRFYTNFILKGTSTQSTKNAEGSTVHQIESIMQDMYQSYAKVSNEKTE